MQGFCTAEIGHGAIRPRRTNGANGSAAPAKIVKAYDYKDADGALLYQVVRLEPKDFRHRQPDAKGGWIYKGTERRVPYRLPDLLKYPEGTVFVCEGEKDADRVASLGYCQRLSPPASGLKIASLRCEVEIY